MIKKFLLVASCGLLFCGCGEKVETIQKVEPQKVVENNEKIEVAEAELETPTPTPTPTSTPTPTPIITEEPIIEEIETSEPIVEQQCTEPEQIEEVYEEPVYESSMYLYNVMTQTFYCPCAECCNSWTGALGVTLTPYYSVALPDYGLLGCTVYLSGTGGYDGYYRVEDVSPSGIVDIFVSHHSEIPSYGMTTCEVYLVG